MKYIPFKSFTKFEWILWIGSMGLVTLAFVLGGDFKPLTLTASLIGVTSLIFVAKGAVVGQFLIVLFSVIYGIISFQHTYYGEMITYVFMTAPIAIMTAVSWIKHPYGKGNEVKVARLSKRNLVLMVVLAVLVTVAFYFILRAFETAQLEISTLSITTSFVASYLMLFRSQNYALAYAANDIVLIVLWVLASMESLAYISMVICFAMFLLNDIYGYYNWRRMRKKQTESEENVSGNA